MGVEDTISQEGIEGVLHLGETPITVKVGPLEQVFFIHPSVLGKSPDLFKAALTQHWSEGQQHQVKLPFDDAAAFSIYATRLYKSTLGDMKFDKLTALYAMGEKRIDIAFQDDVINVMVARCRRKL